MEEFRTSRSAPACRASPECWWKTKASDKLHGKTWRLVRLWSFPHVHEVPRKQIGAWVWEASPNEFQGQIHSSWQIPAPHNCGYNVPNTFFSKMKITHQICEYHICKLQTKPHWTLCGEKKTANHAIPRPYTSSHIPLWMIWIWKWWTKYNKLGFDGLSLNAPYQKQQQNSLPSCSRTTKTSGGSENRVHIIIHNWSIHNGKYV